MTLSLALTGMGNKFCQLWIKSFMKMFCQCWYQKVRLLSGHGVTLQDCPQVTTATQGPSESGTDHPWHLKGAIPSPLSGALVIGKATLRPYRVDTCTGRRGAGSPLWVGWIHSQGIWLMLSSLVRSASGHRVNTSISFYSSTGADYTSPSSICSTDLLSPGSLTFQGPKQPRPGSSLLLDSSESRLLPSLTNSP